MNPQREFTTQQMSATMPLFTGMFYEGYYISGVLWGLLLKSLSLIYEFTLDLLQWFLLTLCIGFLLQLLLSGLKMRRFRNPVTNQELIDLFEEVKSDLGKGEGIQLWIRDVDRSVFLSTVNPFFKALLFSDSTIGDILNKRERGKVVLAKEVLKMERLSPLSRLSIALLGFAFFSLFETIFSSGLPFSLSFSSISLVFIITVVLILLGMTIVPYTLSRKGQGIDEQIEALYDIPPGAAEVEVLMGIPVPKEVIEEIKRDEREGKRVGFSSALKKGAIAAVVAAPFTFIIMYVLVGNSALFLLFASVMTGLITFGAFIFTYMFSELVSMHRAITKKRSSDWDTQNSFSNDIQEFLNSFPKYENLSVRAVKSPLIEQFGLVVLKPNSNLEEDILLALLPQIVDDIRDVELAKPFILSEIRRKDIEKQSNRLGYLIVGIAIPFLVIGMLFALLQIGSILAAIRFLQMMVVIVIVTMTPAIFLSIWKRNAELKSDVEIAQSYPRLREAFQLLIAKRHTLPFGITSYRTRLERVEQKLGYMHQQPSRQSGVELN